MMFLARFESCLLLLVLFAVGVDPSRAHLPDSYHVLFEEVVEGELESETFAYYLIENGVNILLNLTSLEGDCDLYVSQSAEDANTAAASADGQPSKPGLDVHSYDLHSATCGEDVVYVTRDIRRPFTVGIYAHPSYAKCSFQLLIQGVVDRQSEEFDLLLEKGAKSYNDYVDEQSPSSSPSKSSPSTLEPLTKQVNEKLGPLTNFWDILLNILAHILQLSLEFAL